MKVFLEKCVEEFLKNLEKHIDKRPQRSLEKTLAVLHMKFPDFTADFLGNIFKQTSDESLEEFSPTTLNVIMHESLEEFLQDSLDETPETSHVFFSAN